MQKGTGTPTGKQFDRNEPERALGTWRQSKWRLGFWVRAVFTLSLWYWLVYRQNYIMLTTRRVSQRRGWLLATNETALSIENITDVTVNKGPLGSLFGYGDITIQSPGSSGSEISAIGLADPERLRGLIFDLSDGRLDGGNLFKPSR
jgi:membrane protein YdbS with pleckstrin-like domain